jgi:hypothetical protein
MFGVEWNAHLISDAPQTPERYMMQAVAEIACKLVYSCLFSGVKHYLEKKVWEAPVRGCRGRSKAGSSLLLMKNGTDFGFLVLDWNSGGAHKAQRSKLKLARVLSAFDQLQSASVSFNCVLAPGPLKSSKNGSLVVAEMLAKFAGGLVDLDGQRVYLTEARSGALRVLTSKRLAVQVLHGLPCASRRNRSSPMQTRPVSASARGAYSLPRELRMRLSTRCRTSTAM